MESNYYEVIYMNRSSQILQNKEIDYQSNMSIPEIDDSKLTDCIAELQAENEELTTEIENLKEDISLYKRLLGYEQ